MAKKIKNSKIESLKIAKAIYRLSVSNINQKAQVFAHKGIKRNKTRQAQKDRALKEYDY